MLEDEKIIIDITKKVGFLTGSRLFGQSQADSDWDYVVFWPDFCNEFNRARCRLNTDLFYSTRDYFSYHDPHMRSYKIGYDNEIYNIISVWTKKEFNIWKRVSDAFKTVPGNILYLKEDRVELFEDFKKTLRQ